MSKSKSIFVCQTCGAQATRWAGRCAACGSWNTLAEERGEPAPSAGRGRSVVFEEKPRRLKDINAAEDDRMASGLPEFDRVTGGGLVAGSVTLIGGDPGIGKSTLNLQLALRLAAAGRRVLYVSGEESVQQTKLRADRLSEESPDGLFIVNQVDLQRVRAYWREIKPDLVIIDSIQVVFEPELASAPGSVSQVRECAAALTQLAKTSHTALIMIGHVTKDGAIAGPRVLEHIVDTVLYFEGERYTAYRVLRTIKNRFGSTNELGVFEMTGTGLMEVLNPSEIFLMERPAGAPGSVVVPVLEGSRPFLVEVQGLVSRSSFGMVRQKAQGFDANRLALLVAVLEKRLDLNLQDKDVFLNFVGGMKIADPAADLAVVTAVASALLERAVPPEVAVMGEVGLSSEVRSVNQLGLRLNEAQKLGFTTCLVPKNNLKVKGGVDTGGLSIVPVQTVRDALEWIRERGPAVPAAAA